MIFYRHFDIPLLDADIPLCNDCAAVLQKMLYKGNVIAVIFVNAYDHLNPDLYGKSQESHEDWMDKHNGWPDDDDALLPF